LNNTVPGFAFSTFSGGGESQPVTAFVTMTNGLRTPTVLTITP
jgi:hypothetical protein